MHRCLHQLFLGCALALFAPLTAHAGLASLSKLFVFGDSLSDGGNYKNADFLGAFPPSPYAGARYSNGPTAVEYLWQAYNPDDTSFKPSNFGGTNYALGGATTGTTSFNAINPDVPLDLRPYFASQGGVIDQVTKFADSCTTGCFDPATSLFVVWAFGNDVFSNLLSPTLLPATLISNGVTNIVNAIQTLALEGATHFLVPNLADLGATPAFPGNADLTALTVGFNSALAAALTALDQALLAAEIVQFDTFGAFNSLIQNPAAFGMTNVKDQCVLNLTNGKCDPKTWAFWDGVHPTTATHALLGARFAAAVVPEPDSILLIVTALLLLGAMRRTQLLKQARRVA